MGHGCLHAGSSLIVYVLIGFFGAAWISPDNQTGNILQSTLGPVGIYCFLCLSIACKRRLLLDSRA